MAQGHFLLAAARRIATRVARSRTGGVASPADYRHALRDVVPRGSAIQNSIASPSCGKRDFHNRITASLCHLLQEK